MENRFTETAENALNEALVVAKDLKYGYVGSEHLLVGILTQVDSAAARILQAKGIDRERIYDFFQPREKQSLKEVDASDMTVRAKRIIEKSAQIANRFGQKHIGCEHILYAITEESDSVAMKILTSCGVYTSDITEELNSLMDTGTDNISKGRDVSTAGQNQASFQSKNIYKFGTDLTAGARMGKIDPIIGRDKETSRLIQILLRRTKNNPCLIGEPGVGKTAVVEGLANRIAENDVPELLRDKTVFRLDLSSMIAGAKYRGEFEERMKSVVDEVQKQGDIILFIDEIHTIVGAGAAEGAVDAANIMKPALARGNLQVIGATTFHEYQKYIEKDAALERRFQPIVVGQPSEEEAILILKGIRDKFEKHHGLEISDAAIQAAVKMSVKYIPDRYLPDKAIDLIDEAASKKRIEGYVIPEELKSLEKDLQEILHEKENAIQNQNFEKAAQLRDQQVAMRRKISAFKTEWQKQRSSLVMSVSKEDVAKIVTDLTGIPIGSLTESQSDRLLRMETELQKRVIGQDHAVKAVAEVMKRSAVEMIDPDRPKGSFLFLGPTGVGKTELAKTVAETMFGSEDAMIRLDMSEYSEKQSVAKLIGSAPGYIGYDEGGQLTEKVRRRPYSLILLDEIEKAHPDLFNALLQILDEGRLTDSKGRSVNFKNTVIVMTSNIGADAYTSAHTLGFGNTSNNDDMKNQIKKKLTAFFSPEFLNRIDETVIFEQLGKDDVKKIAALMLARIKDRLKTKEIEIVFSDEVMDCLVEYGYDKNYGARPIRRMIRKMIEDKISLSILKGELNCGDCAECVVEDEKIVIRIL